MSVRLAASRPNARQQFFPILGGWSPHCRQGVLFHRSIRSRVFREFLRATVRHPIRTMAIIDPKSSQSSSTQPHASGEAAGTDAVASLESQPLIGNSTGTASNNYNTDSLPPYEPAQQHPPSVQPRWAKHFGEPRTRKRALHFGLITLGLVILAYLLFGGKSISSGGGNGRKDGATPVVPPSQGKPVQDGTWSGSHKLPRGDFPVNWPSSSLDTYQSTTVFNVPISSASALYLHAYGSNYQGSVVFDTDTNLAKGRSYVSILATYHDETVLDRVVIQQLVKDKAQGVGIFGLDHFNYRDELDRLRIDVTWVFPPGVTLPSLETDLHTLSTTYKTQDVTLTNWKHLSKAGSVHLGTLTSKQFLDINTEAGSVNVIASHTTLTSPKVEIHTNAGSVHLDNVFAEQYIHISTDVGSVSQDSSSSKWVTPELRVKSNAGSIHLNGRVEPTESTKKSSVALETDAGSISGGGLKIYDDLTLSANAGSIRGDVELALPPNAGNARRPAKVAADSSAGSVHLQYVAQDSNIDLHSHAKSKTGSVHVTHHENFLGTFELQSTLGRARYTFPKRSTWRNWRIDFEKKPNWGGGGHVKGAVFEKGTDGGEPRGLSNAVADVGSVDATF